MVQHEVGSKKNNQRGDHRRPPVPTTEDVMKVKGIKQGIYNKIKDKITVQ